MKHVKTLFSFMFVAAILTLAGVGYMHSGTVPDKQVISPDKALTPAAPVHSTSEIKGALNGLKSIACVNCLKGVQLTTCTASPCHCGAGVTPPADLTPKIAYKPPLWHGGSKYISYKVRFVAIKLKGKKLANPPPTIQRQNVGKEPHDQFA